MLLAPLSSNFFRKSRNLYLPPTVLNTIKPFIGKCAFLFGHIRQDQEHNQHTIFHIKSKLVTHSSATGNNKSENHPHPNAIKSRIFFNLTNQTVLFDVSHHDGNRKCRRRCKLESWEHWFSTLFYRGGAYIVMDQQTGRPINLFDFCQQIKEVYCGQLTNNCARLL